MLTIGVIGYGYWGPNIVRNFGGIESARTISLCDLSENALGKARKLHPTINTTCNADDILSSKNIDAVAIITPASTHFDLAKKALQNGKHVFVEKPFTSTAAQAEELIELAERKNRFFRLKDTLDLKRMWTYDPMERSNHASLPEGKHVHKPVVSRIRSGRLYLCEDKL